MIGALKTETMGSNANWIKKIKKEEIDKDKNTPYNEDKFPAAKASEIQCMRNFIRPWSFDSLGRFAGIRRVER